jgi:hypothetical protein
MCFRQAGPRFRCGRVLDGTLDLGPVTGCRTCSLGANREVPARGSLRRVRLVQRTPLCAPSYRAQLCLGDLVDDQQFNAVLAHAARTINEARTLEETLQTIVDAARVSIPSMEHVGVSVLDREGRAVTRATTSELVIELDTMQYSLDEGPCVDSLRGAAVISPPDIGRDQRWPRYAPPAVELGLKSQLAVKLSLGNGAPSVVSTCTPRGRRASTPEAPVMADLFVNHAALAVARAMEMDDLYEAMRTREVIGQAAGLLMQRYGLHPDGAIAFLVRSSANSNTEMREIARQIVDQHATEVGRRKGKSLN